jgi:predicted  nucleic acid-binding Zn-ribbon protein
MAETDTGSKIYGLMARMDALERNQERAEKTLLSSVDDIKHMIKAEISELKTEQINDLRAQVRACENRLDAQNLHISDIRTKQENWDSGAGVVGWLVKTAIGIGALIAGYLGAKHL